MHEILWVYMLVYVHEIFFFLCMCVCVCVWWIGIERYTERVGLVCWYTYLGRASSSWTIVITQTSLVRNWKKKKKNRNGQKNEVSEKRVRWATGAQERKWKTEAVETRLGFRRRLLIRGLERYIKSLQALS